MSIKLRNLSQGEKLLLCKDLYKTIESLTLMKYDEETQKAYFNYLANEPTGFESGKKIQSVNTCNQMLEELKTNGYTSSTIFQSSPIKHEVLGTFMEKLEESYMPEAFEFLNKNFYQFMQQATAERTQEAISLSSINEAMPRPDLIKKEIHNAYLGALYPYDIEKFTRLKKAYNQNMTKESENGLNNTPKIV